MTPLSGTNATKNSISLELIDLHLNSPRCPVKVFSYFRD